MAFRDPPRVDSMNIAPFLLLYIFCGNDECTMHLFADRPPLRKTIIESSDDDKLLILLPVSCMYQVCNYIHCTMYDYDITNIYINSIKIFKGTKLALQLYHFVVKTTPGFIIT